MDPLEQKPAEDSGHDTARWYRYQYAVTAADCLKLLVDPALELVVEWHTDFLIVQDGVTSELVSVKYREPDSGRWTLASLLGQGGLPTLFARWVAADRRPRCRLVTNAGLAPGDLEARVLSRAIAAPIPTSGACGVDSFVEPFSKRLGCSDEIAREFLLVLTIEVIGADHRSAEALVIEEVARPHLERLGCSAGYARDAVKTTIALVWDAATGFQPEEPSDWKPTPLDEVPVARKVDRARLVGRLNGSGIPLPQHTGSGTPTNPSDTVMARKLRAGGLGPSVQSSAPRVRSLWYELETSYRDDVPGPFAGLTGRIRGSVVTSAIDAEAATRTGGTAYGQAMHNHLMRDLRDKIQNWLIVTDPSELLGCAYQLTDECEIWWSDRFDPTDDAPWLDDSGGR